MRIINSEKKDGTDHIAIDTELHVPSEIFKSKLQEYF